MLSDFIMIRFVFPVETTCIRWCANIQHRDNSCPGDLAGLSHFTVLGVSRLLIFSWNMFFQGVRSLNGKK